MKFLLSVGILSLLAGVILESCCECPDGKIQVKKYYLDTLNTSWYSDDIRSGEGHEVYDFVYGFYWFLKYRADDPSAFTAMRSWFVSSAQATSCDCEERVKWYPASPVVSLEVFTRNDFDENHPAFSDVSSYFEVDVDGRLVSLSEFVEYENRVKQGYLHGTEINLLLIENPTFSGDIQFDFSLTLENGTVFTHSTPSIATTW